jgi:hypothetical protein
MALLDPRRISEGSDRAEAVWQIALPSTRHDLFSCADQDEAEEFAREILASHAQQPKLL